jgi:hypothetical protein
MGFEWEKVLPAWFRVLSTTVEPALYAPRVAAVLDRHYSYKRAVTAEVAGSSPVVPARFKRT